MPAKNKMVPKVLREFMRNLEINNFLDDYVVSRPTFEPLTELITNECPIENRSEEASQDTRTSNWLNTETHLPQNGTVIFHMEIPKATILVPVKWQYSMEKLLSEFISISYLTWDLTSMTAWQATKEFFRRLKVTNNFSNQ